MANTFDGKGAAPHELTNEDCWADSMPEIRNLNLDDVDFGPILNLVEQLLTKARLLADWTDDGEIGWVKDQYTGEPASDTFTGELIPAGELGYTGAELLQQIAEKWIDLYCVMSANGLWENWVCYYGGERRHAAVRCLYDLHRTVFKKEEWIEILPMNYDPKSGEAICYGSLPPSTRLGMPHVAFARQLTVAVELLRAIVLEGKSQRKRMTVEEANEMAQNLARKLGKGFLALSQRQQAKKIGCSWLTLSRTPFYKAAQKIQPVSGRKKPASPRTESLTSSREAVTGEGDKDETLNKLIAEQEADKEPSPLEGDPSSGPFAEDSFTQAIVSACWQFVSAQSSFR